MRSGRHKCLGLILVGGGGGINFVYLKAYRAGPSCRAVWGVGLRPLFSWDYGFESHRRHRCLSERCLLSGRGLCDELITSPEKSYWLWYVVVCDLETSWMRRPWPTGGCHATKQTNKQTKLTGLSKTGEFSPSEWPERLKGSSSLLFHSWKDGGKAAWDAKLAIQIICRAEFGTECSYA